MTRTCPNCGASPYIPDWNDVTCEGCSHQCCEECTKDGLCGACEEKRDEARFDDHCDGLRDC